MKKKFFYLLIAAVTTMGFASSCSDDDDDDNLTATEIASIDLQKRYPDVKNVEWSKKANYIIAEFTYLPKYPEVDAWYTTTGQWAMSENDCGKDLFLIPAAVNEGFNKTEYRTWTVDDIDFYEYPDNTRDFYVIEVEQAGQSDTDLYFKPDGTLIKTVPNDNSEITPDTVI